VQEVFLTIWEKKNFTSVYHFRFYLHAIAKNLCLRYFKKLDHETRANKEFSYDREMSDNSRERYDYLLQLESMELHIGDAIEKLPPQRKQIFELVNVNGLSYDDIAGKLNISQETVRTQVKRALRNIRHHLELQNGSALLYPTGAFLITLLE
jgi:RNA polymerase sigma-70 factor (ECF subfamily)